MFRLMMCAVVSCLVCDGLALAADPPKPDAKKPVDYVGWINTEFGKDVKDNAAKLYNQAIAARAEDAELAASLAKTHTRDFTPEQRKDAAAWVKRNAKALKHFEAAAAKDGCFFDLKSDDGSVMAVMLPMLKPIRELARIVEIRGRLRLADGDIEQAVDDAITLYRVARHMEAQPYLISCLVGIAIRQLASNLLLDLPTAAGKEADYALIARRVEEVAGSEVDLRRQILAEKVMAWDSVQRLLIDDDGDGRYDRIDPRLEEASEDGQKGVFDKPETFDEIIAKINAYYGGAELAAAQDYPQGIAEAGKLEEKLASEKGTALATFAFSPCRAFTLRTRAAAGSRAAVLVLRLRAHRAKEGKWPAELKDLLPKKASTPGTDPFSAKPFVYRLEKGQPLLYSVSENGKDDGGEAFRDDHGKIAWGSVGDYVFWPPQAGSDS